MVQPALFETHRLTVSELTRRVKRLLEGDPELANVWVQAEISNFTRPVSGHLYFTLKDSGSSLRCVMWKGDAARLRGLALQDGLSVEVHGRITVYEPSGQYQLIVDILRPAGEGALFAEFMRLKSILEAEGLFSNDRKRVLVDFPSTIGIVTSSTGAALQDMLNVLRRRLPLARVVLSPTAVQGLEAPTAIVQAIQLLNKIEKPDVILLARGGGSIEDLWAFNDERVVRAVAASQSPIITGVGHETDFTLVDFAADLRAPTPTAAAEMATRVTVDDCKVEVRKARQHLQDILLYQINTLRTNLGSLTLSLRYQSPIRQLQTESQRLDELVHRADRAIKQRLSLESIHLRGVTQHLDSLSPLNVLQRGYAVVTRELDGMVVQSSEQAPTGSMLNIRLAAGSLNVNVMKSLLEEA